MAEHRICIAQCLCPRRHAILAMAFDDRDCTPARACEWLMMRVADRVNKGEINPWCGICGSRVFTCESGRTPWTTLDEARPHLAAAELGNMLGMALMGGHDGRTPTDG